MGERDMRALGRLGGLATYAKYGSRHMAENGAKGFARYVAEKHNGNRAAARACLGLDGKRRDFNSTPADVLAWLEERKGRNDGIDAPGIDAGRGQ